LSYNRESLPPRTRERFNCFFAKSTVDDPPPNNRIIREGCCYTIKPLCLNKTQTHGKTFNGAECCIQYNNIVIVSDDLNLYKCFRIMSTGLDGGGVESNNHQISSILYRYSLKHYWWYLHSIFDMIIIDGHYSHQ